MTTLAPLDLLPADPAEARRLIERAVLQQDPLRLLDRVLAQGQNWIEAEWRVPADGSLCRGDERARILPGTICTEHVVQAGELLIFALRGETTPEEGVPVLTRIRRAKFRGMIRPNDLLTTRVELLEELGPVYRVRGQVSVDDARVLDVVLDFAATKALAERAGN
jgi:3-hydroxymyristoyl/3-hydroxydecanoyl-(acyl carrier protein) dehydratase